MASGRAGPTLSLRRGHERVTELTKRRWRFSRRKRAAAEAEEAAGGAGGGALLRPQPRRAAGGGGSSVWLPDAAEVGPKRWPLGVVGAGVPAPGRGGRGLPRVTGGGIACAGTQPWGRYFKRFLR